MIDEPALIAALEEGRLGGAILDVFATEPLPAKSPLWGMPNVTVTSHLAGTSDAHDFVAAFAENFSHLSAGFPLLDEVDRAAGY